MSAASDKVTCTRCNFHGLLPYRPVRIVYRLPDGAEVKSARTFGWCARCNDIRDIELGLEAQPLRERLEVLRRRTQTISFRIQCALDKLLGGRANEIEEEITDTERQLRLAETRTSKPRCLMCGSEDTIPLSFDEQGLSKNYIHECGGHLRREPADPDAPRFFYNLETIVLDPEGRRLAP